MCQQTLSRILERVGTGNNKMFSNPALDSTSYGNGQFLSQHGATDLKHLRELFKVSLVFGEQDWEQQVNDGQVNGDCYAMLPYTNEDYKINVNNQAILHIQGDKMQPAWSHVTAPTSLHDSVTMMCYHLSQLHKFTNDFNKFYVVIFKVNMINFMNHEKDEAASIFCRANCSTMLQFHKVYQLHCTEITQQTHLEFAGPIAAVFDKYNWSTGYAWTYHIPINIRDVLNNVDNDESHAHYAFRQCLEYAGTTMLVNLPADLVKQVIVYIHKFGNILSNNENLTENHMRGSTSHAVSGIQRMFQAVLKHRQSQQQMNQQVSSTRPGLPTAMPSVTTTSKQDAEENIDEEAFDRAQIFGAQQEDNM